MLPRHLFSRNQTLPGRQLNIIQVKTTSKPEQVAGLQKTQYIQHMVKRLSMIGSILRQHDLQGVTVKLTTPKCTIINVENNQKRIDEHYRAHANDKDKTQFDHKDLDGQHANSYQGT